MKPRVALVTNQYPPEVGGVGQSAQRVARLTAEAGWDVDVVVLHKHAVSVPLDESITSHDEDGITVHRVRVHHPDPAHEGWAEALTRYNREMFQALDYLHQRRRYQALHGFFLYPAGYVATRVGRLHRVPTIVSIRGNDVGKYAFDPLRLPFVRTTLEHADAVTSVATRLTEFADRTITPIASRSRTILNSVEPQSLVLHGRPELDTPGFVIGSAGLFRYKKGLSTLFRALERLTGRFGFTLLLAGDYFRPEDREPHERALAAAGLMDRVVFTGKIPAERFADHLALFDVLVFPSLFSEGCPRVMIEAMALGKAVIGARSGAIPEVIRDGENGLLVSPGSTDELVAAITVLIEDAQLRARLGAQAAQIARELSPERERQAWLDVLAHVSGRRPVEQPA